MHPIIIIIIRVCGEAGRPVQRCILIRSRKICDEAENSENAFTTDEPTTMTTTTMPTTIIIIIFVSAVRHEMEWRMNATYFTERSSVAYVEAGESVGLHTFGLAADLIPKNGWSCSRSREGCRHSQPKPTDNGHLTKIITYLTVIP